MYRIATHSRTGAPIPIVRHSAHIPQPATMKLNSSASLNPSQGPKARIGRLTSGL
jgi:hypothetical protein